jgi:hypothetical protein
MRSAHRSRARVPHVSTSSRPGGGRRAIPTRVLAGLGTAWVLAGAGFLAAAVAVAEEPARKRPLRAFAVGIGEDYASDRRTPDAARRDLNACRRAGASVLRIRFSWSEMEPQPGRYDFACWDKVVPMAVDEYGLDEAVRRAAGRGLAGRATGRPDGTGRPRGDARRPGLLRELLWDHGVSLRIDVVNWHSDFKTWHDGAIEGLRTYLGLY